MEENMLVQFIDELGLKEHIEFESIPNLDLYMDQVITLFEEKLNHTKRYESDKLLTKTMINNYTKDKLLMPAVKKKYTKEHIILMILLYELKQILTIGDIKNLFRTIIKDDKVDCEQLANIYKIYLSLQEKNIDEFKEEVRESVNSLKGELLSKSADLVEDISEKTAVQDMLTVILLTEKANYYKRLAEKIIDKRITNRA